MNVTECMRKSLGLPDWVESIEMSNGYPWNAWIVAENGFSEFRTGLYWQALEHLKDCEKCREVVGISSSEVEERLKEIEREWREVTDP